MTSKAESLAEAIMKMAEEDRGLVKSKLVELIEQKAEPELVSFAPSMVGVTLTRRFVDPPLVKSIRQAK